MIQPQIFKWSNGVLYIFDASKESSRDQVSFLKRLLAKRISECEAMKKIGWPMPNN